MNRYDVMVVLNKDRDVVVGFGLRYNLKHIDSDRLIKFEDLYLSMSRQCGKKFSNAYLMHLVLKSQILKKIFSKKSINKYRSKRKHNRLLYV